MKILIVDNDMLFLSMLDTYLHLAKFQTEQLQQGETIWECIERVSPDLIVLDALSYKLSIEEFCKQLSTQTEIPIIILVQENTEKKVVNLLEHGADDVLVKPVRPLEFIARVESVLRRTNRIKNSRKIVLNNGALTIDVELREVCVLGKVVNLTLTEFDILHILVVNRPNVFSRLQLVERVKGLEFDGMDRIIDTHIKNLRKKIEEVPSKPEYIITVHGIGYKCGVL